MEEWTKQYGEEAERSHPSRIIVSLADFFLRHQKLVSAGKQMNAEVYQQFLRQHVAPLGQEDISWWKYEV